MKSIIAAAIFLLSSFSFSAIAEEKDVVGYTNDLYWRMSIENAKKKCEPYFKVGKEGDFYYCNRFDEFQGVNFVRSSGIGRKLNMFRPPINNTILRFIKNQLREVDIVFIGKPDANELKAQENLQDARKYFLDILVAEFGKPKKSAKKDEISLYRNLDTWSYLSGCIMFYIASKQIEGHLTLKDKEMCGTM